MWAGIPSAAASSSLPAVTMAQEKSRDWPITAERAVRITTPVISRRIASIRLAMIATCTGSSSASPSSAAACAAAASSAGSRM